MFQCVRIENQKHTSLLSEVARKVGCSPKFIPLHTKMDFFKLKMYHSITERTS